jgi:hypothetical protein
VLLVASALVAGVAAAAGAAPPAIGAPAPEIAGERWIGSAPLTTGALRGRVVLVEFWTYG